MKKWEAGLCRQVVVPPSPRRNSALSQDTFDRTRRELFLQKPIFRHPSAASEGTGARLKGHAGTSEAPLYTLLQNT